MAAANKTIWGIHTMDDPLFLNQNLIAIGWEEMGDLSVISASRDAYKEKYIATYPDAKKVRFPQVLECCTGSFMKCEKAIILCSHLSLTVKSISGSLRAPIFMIVQQHSITIVGE